MMPMGTMMPQHIPAVQQPMIPADMGGGRPSAEPTEESIKEVSKPKKMKKRKVLKGCAILYSYSYSFLYS